ncbi:hypothetical protein GUJ93_ZPchr0586g11356 [Zizania palustris]|uniref:Uncharacterized protein n=1 Tax=Zizania palustris TaxID=103762 RepID=A0A8J5UZD2_ZIZPA|nr:hypothetical protein GUJ93_ZPchr0586g11356 [Zizania palustris]
MSCCVADRASTLRQVAAAVVFPQLPRRALDLAVRSRPAVSSQWQLARDERRPSIGGRLQPSARRVDVDAYVAASSSCKEARRRFARAPVVSTRVPLGLRAWCHVSTRVWVQVRLDHA